MTLTTPNNWGSFFVLKSAEQTFGKIVAESFGYQTNVW